MYAIELHFYLIKQFFVLQTGTSDFLPLFGTQQHFFLNYQNT